MSRHVRLALLTAAFATVAAAPALAGQGGATGGSTGAAWITASPNPAAAGGSRVDLDGCGYEMRPVTVRVIHSAGYTESYGAGIWSPGCIDTYFYTAEAGAYTIEVWQSSSSKKRSTLVFKASTVLTVE